MKVKKEQNLIIFLAVTFIVIIAFIFFSSGEKTKKSGLTLSLQSKVAQVSTGDEVKVGIYLSGKDALNATVFEIVLQTDVSKLELVDATPGELVASPLLLEWDVDKGVFAMAVNPQNDTEGLLEGSIIDLTFVALSPGKASINITNPQIYISKTGVETPNIAPVTLIINARED